MNSDVYFEIVLILLCMYFAYKWKQEKVQRQYYQQSLRDRQDLIQVYKRLLANRKKETTRMQNELNKVNNVYLKLQKEVERQKKSFL